MILPMRFLSPSLTTTMPLFCLLLLARPRGLWHFLISVRTWWAPGALPCIPMWWWCGLMCMTVVAVVVVTMATYGASTAAIVVIIAVVRRAITVGGTVAFAGWLAEFTRTTEDAADFFLAPHACVSNWTLNWRHSLGGAPPPGEAATARIVAYLYSFSSQGLHCRLRPRPKWLFCLRLGLREDEECLLGGGEETACTRLRRRWRWWPGFVKVEMRWGESWAQSEKSCRLQSRQGPLWFV